MILHWHPEMDVIMDAYGHRRAERDERRANSLDEVAARREARDYLADAALIEFLSRYDPAAPGSAAPGPWPAPPPDPADEVKAVLAEPLGLDAGALISRFPDWPAGTCKDCRMPRDTTHPLCWYCREAAALKPPPAPVPPPARESNRRTAACMLAIMTAFTLLILSVKLAVPWLELASVAPFIAGVRGMRK